VSDPYSGPAGPPPPRYEVPPEATSAAPQYVPGPPIFAPPPDGASTVTFPPGGYPVAPAAAGPRPGLVGGIVAIVAAVILVPVIALVTVWLVVAGSSPAGDDRAPIVPTAAPSWEADDPDGTDGPAVPAGEVEATLQRMIDDYKASLRDGSLWERIPETEFNQTAVTAFLYLLTDLRLAASFGGDTSGYLEEAEELERKLLAQEPLGSDIRIVLSDRTFTYDGETGEGGYTDN